MRYPISGSGSKEEFERDWYIADGFGTNRGTYLHEGLDINLRSGGDTDLGQHVYAIAEGKKKYYHFVSHSTTGFGIHYVYQIEGPWGTRWVHCAHNQTDSPIKDKQNFPEGEHLSNIGKSGTQFAHLHLAIFKVDPSLIRNGIDTVAKTQTELNDWWEDPLAFITAWIGYKPPVEEEGYTVMYKGAVLTKYDFNPDDKIKELNEKIGAQAETLSQFTTENAVCRTSLTEQQTDNSSLINQLRDTSRERDEFRVENNRLVGELAIMEKEIQVLKTKLEEKNPLAAYSRWEILKYLLRIK